MERQLTKTEILEDLLSRSTPELTGECILLIEEFFELKLDKRTQEYQQWKTRCNELIKSCNKSANFKIYKPIV